MVKLVVLRSETTYDVQFGTCELCMSTGTLIEEWFVFEDGEGNIHEIATGGWDWGDYDVYYDVENVADFCQFILGKNIPDFETLEKDFHKIYEEYTDKVYKEKYPDEDCGCFELDI